MIIPALTSFQHCPVRQRAFRTLVVVSPNSSKATRPVTPSKLTSFIASMAAARADLASEASFKATEAKAAFEGQAKLTEFVRGQGWFLAEDSLKTKLIMDRYGKGS